MDRHVTRELGQGPGRRAGRCIVNVKLRCVPRSLAEFPTEGLIAGVLQRGTTNNALRTRSCSPRRTICFRAGERSDRCRASQSATDPLQFGVDAVSRPPGRSDRGAATIATLARTYLPNFALNPMAACVVCDPRRQN